MGLVNENGHYVKVTRVDIKKNKIDFDLYKDKKTRDDGLGMFDQTHGRTIRCAKLKDALAKKPVGDTVLDCILTAGYEALKTEPPFNNATEEKWEDA